MLRTLKFDPIVSVMVTIVVLNRQLGPPEVSAGTSEKIKKRTASKVLINVLISSMGNEASRILLLKHKQFI